MRTTRGFTLIEVVIVAALLVVIMGSAMGMATTGQTVATSSTHKMKASTRAHGLAERILSELRQASIHAEDLDEDDDPLDLELEDTNGNGRIDDDWSLADGGTDNRISFNRALGGKQYTDKITIRFDGETVWHESGTATVASTVLATDVTALTFTRRGNRITVNIEVESGVGNRGGKQITLRRDIMLRN